MIYDHIGNRGLYRGIAPEGMASGELDAALAALAELWAAYEASAGAAFEAGRKVVIAEDGRGPRAWYTLQEYRTKPRADCVLEAHRAHADIHFYLGGEDGVGLARASACPGATEYDAEKDFRLHAPPADMPVLAMRPGSFLVCFPDDAHMCMVAAPGREAPVRKAICKIRL